MNALSTFRDVMRKEFAVTKEVHEAIKSELLEELGLREGASVQEQRRSKGSPRSAPAERNRTLSVSPQRRKEEKKPRRTPPRSGGYDSWDSSPGNRRDRRQRSTWKQDMDCNPPLLDQPMEGTSKRKFETASGPNSFKPRDLSLAHFHGCVASQYFEWTEIMLIAGPKEKLRNHY